MRLLLLLPVLFATAAAQGTGTLAGRVTDAATGEGLPGAKVVLEGTQLGAATDLNGNYRIIVIPVGEYDVTARYVGFEEETVTAVQVSSGYTTQQDFSLGGWTPRPSLVERVCTNTPVLFPPLMNCDPFASRVIYSWDIENLPVER